MASLFENAGRKKYVCPTCQENFAGPYKTWEHAKQEHRDILGGWESKEEEEKMKKEFLKDALMYVNPHTLYLSNVAPWTAPSTHLPFRSFLAARFTVL